MEALVTGTIATVVIAGIVVFFSFVGNRMEAVSRTQRLSEESAFYGELLCREIRRAKSVSAASATGEKLHIVLNGNPETPNLFLDRGPIPLSKNASGSEAIRTPYQSQIAMFAYSPLIEGLAITFQLTKDGDTFPPVTVNCICKNGTRN